MKFWRSLLTIRTHFLSNSTAKINQSKISSTITSKANTGDDFTSKMPSVYIHSTFRDRAGQQLIPRGLQWNMNGQSNLRFAVPNMDDATPENLVQAYNRWCCAKDLPYKTTDDIQSIAQKGDNHVNVTWKEGNDHVEHVVRGNNMEALLREDEAFTKDDKTAEVWINGECQGALSKDHPDSLPDILAKIPKTANRLRYKRTADRIHIDRHYRGALRKDQAWDHVWDNLVALEDPKILDPNTIIGTATLKDWIMGGQLTSRMWIQDKGTSILFKRPLHNDDLSSSDRRYEVSDEKRMAMVREEVERLRYLANLEHPYVVQLEVKANQEESKAEEKKDEVEPSPILPRLLDILESRGGH
mmetsp:Transcript_32415/g.78731  ORF Transcript_32415/g.78731 Transcript_32415/m.78731 type:complete len:357 (-) Transcript_32415:87-1157(-)